MMCMHACMCADMSASVFIYVPMYKLRATENNSFETSVISNAFDVSPHTCSFSYIQNLI